MSLKDCVVRSVVAGSGLYVLVMYGIPGAIFGVLSGRRSDFLIK